MNRIPWPLALFVLAAPMTTPMAQEQPLICFGNEPFWGLDLAEEGKARFSTPDSAAVDYLGSANWLSPRKEGVWRGQGPGGALVAFLREGPCSDGMSDTMHPYSVNVSLPDGRHLAGCCRFSEAPVVSGALENTTWRLTELPGHELPSDAAQSAATMRFEDGNVHGFSGCNRLIGSYSLEGDRLVLGNLGGTMMACPEPAMSLESRFLEAFSGVLQVSVAGDVLVLTPAGGGDALRFVREAPPRLEGVQWEVTGYNNGREAVVSPKAGTLPTVMFEDGRVSGSSGCNRFHGPFTLEGDTLAIGPLASTRKACEEGLMSQERELLSALESAATWQIERGMLDVHRADGARALTARQAGY